VLFYASEMRAFLNRNSVRPALILALVTLLCAALPAQAPQPPRGTPVRADETAGTTAILVDTVVRDRQGRPVTDLKAADFELYEDGVQQDIASFTIVARGGGIGVDVRWKDPSTTVVLPGAGGEPAAPVDAQTLPAVTAFVFDALSADALALCQRAALSYLPLSGSTGARIGVFATEPSVRVVQRYTDHPALVRQAIRGLAPTGTSVKEQQTQRLDDLAERRNALETSAQAALNATATTPGALSTAGAALGQVEMERRLVAGEMRMLRAFETLDRDQRGFGNTNALASVLTTLAELPGRKTLVFFSEGLPASPALQAQLQSVIETANRLNVTIYAIDATGLRAISSTSDAAKQIHESGRERLRQVGQDFTEGPISMILERNEDLLRYDDQAGLARLAEDTGGFLIRDTNNLRSAFERVDEDMRFHYLLTYSPSNQKFDGKFRSIQVKTKRGGLRVFARSGYRALRAAPTLPVFTYEAPALALLDSATLPDDYPSRAAAFVFPDPDRPGLVPIVVRVKTNALRFEGDERKGSYSAQAAIVVRFRDAQDRMAYKTSQQYVISGEAKDVDAAKRGEILFYREAELPPGVYRMESIVYDVTAERASGRASTIEVPVPDASRLRVSSVVIVDRTERADSARAPGSPFQYDDVLLYPNVGDPLSKRDAKELSFYFTAYPAEGRESCQASVALLRSGRPLAEAPPIALVGKSGERRLQHVGRIPIDTLPPGTYELRVTLADGRDSATRSAFFTLQ